VTDVFLGPATPDVIRVGSRPCFWMEVLPVVDSRTCPECDQPIVPVPGAITDSAVLGVWHDAPSLIDLYRWYHPLCGRTASRGKMSAMAIGMPGRAGEFALPEHPVCARCGDAWADHLPRNEERTRRCQDEAGLYHRAPGLVGVERASWIVIAGENDETAQVKAA
jgi:hypothetical protein